MRLTIPPVVVHLYILSHFCTLYHLFDRGICFIVSLTDEILEIFEEIWTLVVTLIRGVSKTGFIDSKVIILVIKSV